VIEKSGKVGATVFIPDGNEPLPAIVFSHSAIHGPNNDTDLLRFAWALARAGAASIVLDGVIDWQSGPNDDSIRPPEFQFCAGQWLLSHCGIERSGHALCLARWLLVGLRTNRASRIAEHGWDVDSQGPDVYGSGRTEVP
jgi:hypothetical protein